MDLEGLSSICAGLGLIVEDENGNRIGYRKSEFCLDNLNDLRRFLRRDDPQTRDVFKQVCKWNTVSKDLVPIIEQYQEDRNLVIAALKILVYVTMPVEAGSSDIPDQIDYLWELKEALSCSVTIAVIVSLLEDPLENLERGAFTEDDFKLVQLVLTLFKNILGIHDISMQQKASGSATKFLSLRDRFLELLFQENVADLILALTQYVGGSCAYLREDNLLLLEIYHYIFLGQEPELIAKASKNGSEVKKDVKASLNSLSSTMEEEKDKRRLTRIKNLDRHSQFRGSFTRLAMDGSKSLFKGNPGTASRDSLLEPHKVQRGPVKRIAWDNGRLSSSNETILKLLHDFMKQFISAGYNVLMQSIREDIEKEHDAFQNNDVVVFFQLSQFVTAFQHHTFLISKSKMGTDSSEAFVNKVADGTFFQGDICGPIAATMNEAMFLLVISKWRYAFEGLKETNDYKFLSVAGSLMKNMIRMLDLVLKLLPEDSKEPQTARILLYKIFYDQTDQGMTQFLVNLIKAFDTHKQPKSDLADLIEMIRIVVRLMENLEARGTLRVSKKSRRGRKKKVLGDMKGTENERLGEDQVNVNGDAGNSTCEPSVESSMPLRELSEKPSSDGKEKSVLVPNQVEESEIPPMDNTVDESVQKNNKEFSHDPDDIECGTGDSSEDDQLVATHEVDFKVSSLVSTFANNIIIQNLCWLLKFYKSNSASTNHYILTMLRRICDDLELSPMLYQLSLLTTFYSILAEQKSSPRKEYANIVSFLTNLVRKMLKKMKNQPLLFVEALFWKTRRECHYISSESLLNELGNLRKESRNWGNVSSGNEGEIGSSQGKGGISRRSIADALGDDEIDLVISHEPNYQKKPYAAKLQKVTQRDEDGFTEGNRNMTSKSSSEMDGIENLESDDAHNEAHSFEHKTQKVSKRRKRLVFNPELETDIKDLHEKYKDERHCNRLIAEALDPTGGVSPAQVSTKLKQLGLKIASKKRTYVDGTSFKVDGQIESEGQVVENDSIVHSLEEQDENSLLKRSSHSRKRVRAFSKEQEVIIKKLYEQFKHHKKCSHMIANALDADNTFTAAQVSRKIKQLGLMKEKREAKKPLIDEDSDGLIADREDESDKETLLALKERRKNNKKNKIFREDVTATGFPKQKIERKSQEDDSDEEVLSSILGRTRTKQPKEQHGKLETSTVEMTIVEAPRDQIARDEHSPSNEPGLSHKDAEHDDLIQLDSDGEADQVGSINGIKQADILMTDVNHVSSEVMLEELEDSGDDDVLPIASTNVVSRRKMKMVIDMDDDE